VFQLGIAGGRICIVCIAAGADRAGTTPQPRFDTDNTDFPLRDMSAIQAGLTLLSFATGRPVGGA
jgi:hypothetical protein